MPKIHLLGLGKISGIEFGQKTISEDRNSLNFSEHF